MMSVDTDVIIVGAGPTGRACLSDRAGSARPVPIRKAGPGPGAPASLDTAPAA